MCHNTQQIEGFPPNGRTHFFIQNSWCQGFGSKSHPKKRSWKDVKSKKCPKMPSKVCPTLIQHWWYHGLNPTPRPQGLGAGGLEDSPRSSSRAWGSVRARAMGHPAPGDPKIAGEWMCIPSKWAVFFRGFDLSTYDRRWSLHSCCCPLTMPGMRP